jgi:hypothetical protein
MCVRRPYPGLPDNAVHWRSGWAFYNRQNPINMLRLRSGHRRPSSRGRKRIGHGAEGIVTFVRFTCQ